MIHGIKFTGWMGIEDELEYILPPRTFLASDGPGRRKTSIQRAIKFTMSGSCEGTDARGVGYKQLVNHNSTEATLQLILRHNGDQMGIGRRLPLTSKPTTWISENGTDPDEGAPLDDCIEKFVGVGGDALLPCFQPLAFLAMSDADRQAMMLAACGRFTFEELQRRTGKPITDLQALSPRAEGMPLRRAVNRLVAKVKKERLSSDKLIDRAQGRISELKDLPQVEAPGAGALAEAEEAAEKAQAKYQKLVARSTEADTAAGELKKAQDTLATVRAATGEDSPILTKRHHASGRVVKAKKALVAMNKRRVAEGLKEARSVEDLTEPGDTRTLLQVLKFGCPACQYLTGQHGTECAHAEPDPEGAAEWEAGADAEGRMYASALQSITELREARVEEKHWNAEWERDEPTHATQLRAAEAAVEAAEARKKPRPKQPTIEKALQAAEKAHEAHVDLQAASKASEASEGLTERLETATADAAAATRAQRQWRWWEKVLDPASAVMTEWAGEVAGRYNAGLPGALKAISDGTLELTGEGPEVNGRAWWLLSRGEQALLGVAVAMSWSRAMGLTFIVLDDVDVMGAALAHVLRTLNRNGGATGTVILAGVGVDARCMAEAAGWEVLAL